MEAKGVRIDLPRSCPASIRGVPRFTAPDRAISERFPGHLGLEHDDETTVAAAAAVEKTIGRRGAPRQDRLPESGSGQPVSSRVERAPLEPGGPVEKVRKRRRVRRAERQQQIADVTLKLVAKYGVHGATISRIAAGVGLSRAALYKYFPNREAMLEAAMDRLIERVPRWVARSSGDSVLERLMDMGSQFTPLGLSIFESYTRPWFQFVAASGTGKLTEELGKRHLMFVREFADLIEEGKRDGSIREDADTNLAAWSLMMWAWAADVARVIGLEQVIGGKTSAEIFKRTLGDIAAREVG